MFVAQLPNSGEYESFVNQYITILKNQIQMINDLNEKDKIKIGILFMLKNLCSEIFSLSNCGSWNWWMCYCFFPRGLF